jgi:hypothetical protein
LGQAWRAHLNALAIQSWTLYACEDGNEGGR